MRKPRPGTSGQSKSRHLESRYVIVIIIVLVTVIIITISSVNMIMVSIIRIVFNINL